MRAARVVTGVDRSVTQVVLVAHGSRDPRAATTVRALARAVAVARPDVVVHDAYLDFDVPHASTVLARLRDQRVIVVPLLLSAAYHACTDLPAIVEAARDRGGRVEIADVLADPRDGGFELIVAALHRRLSIAGLDAIVLAAAGTRDLDALAGIDAMAAALGRVAGIPCIAGYASGAGRPVAEALAYLSATEARNIGIAAYFLAPGRLYERIVEASGVSVNGPRAGRPVVAQPLGDSAEIVAIASRRIDRCLIASEALV